MSWMERSIKWDISSLNFYFHFYLIIFIFTELAEPHPWVIQAENITVPVFHLIGQFSVKTRDMGKLRSHFYSCLYTMTESKDFRPVVGFWVTFLNLLLGVVEGACWRLLADLLVLLIDPLLLLPLHMLYQLVHCHASLLRHVNWRLDAVVLVIRTPWWRKGRGLGARLVRGARQRFLGQGRHPLLFLTILLLLLSSLILRPVCRVCGLPVNGIPIP